jgi:hypothetical protein
MASRQPRPRRRLKIVRQRHRPTGKILLAKNPTEFKVSALRLAA